MKPSPSYQELQNKIKLLERTTNIIERSPVVVFLWKNKKNWPVKFVSENVVNLFGYSAEEFLANKVIYGNLIHTEDLKRVTKEINLLIDSSESISHKYYRIICKSGEIKWVRDETNIIRDKNRKITGFEGIIIDVSKQIEAEHNLKEKNKELLIAQNKTLEEERNFRLLFERSPLGIYIATPFGRIIDINQAALNILGSPSKEATKQINVLRYEPLIKNGYADKFLKCIKKGEIVTIELFYKSKWGNEDFLSNYIIPLKDSEGKIEKIYTIMENITFRKKVEKELRESNITKDKFFSIIAHDLKNPFNSILGFSNLLLNNHKEYDDQKREEVIEFVYSSAKSAYRLLENLLTWSHSQSGRIEYNPEKLQLKEIVKETLENLHEMACKKNIQILTLNLENKYVFADKNMIATVLRNLISNAIKFTNKKGKITIESEKQTSGNFIEISVKDTGLGISKKRIDDLFRIDKTTSTKGTENETGTGLGLVLCKEFIKKHGGKIWAKSEIGKGSCFRFTIPCVKSNSL